MAIQIRRGTDSGWESNNSNIVAGEPAVALDTERFFVGTDDGEYMELVNIDTIAPAYDSSTSYNVGDYCVYQGKLYVCNSATTGSWTSADWNEISVKQALDDLATRSVPTSVREAIYTLLNSAAYATTGLTDEIAIVESWAEAVTSLTLSASTLSLSGNTPQALIPTVVPSSASVSWSSSDNSIATVVGGVVTGVSNGSCVITATAGNLTANCAVTVSGFTTLESISAVYTQSGTVYDTTPLDDLKTDLVVTATYSDTSTATIPSTDYTLSGTLEVGTSTITVHYSDKTTTFNVTVSSVSLPEGYTRVEYLYSPATSSTKGNYVNTGIVMGTPSSVTFKIGFREESTSPLETDQIMIGTRQNNTGSTNAFGFTLRIPATEHTTINAWSSDPGASAAVDDAYQKRDVIATWTTTGLTIQEGDNPVVTSTQTTRAIGGYPICLFGVKHAVNADGGTPAYFRGYIYYAEAEADGVSVMKLYPCTRDSDSKPGFYDIVNDAFYVGYKPYGTSNISAGPVVGE